MHEKRWPQRSAEHTVHLMNIWMRNNLKDLAVSGPPLYWLSHWSSLWSTKGDEGEEGGKVLQASARSRTHTHAICQSHYFLTLSFSLARISVHTHSPKTQTCRSWGSLLRQGTRCSLELLHRALQCCSSDICTARAAGTMWGLALISYTHTNECMHTALVLGCFWRLNGQEGRLQTFRPNSVISPDTRLGI